MPIAKAPVGGIAASVRGFGCGPLEGGAACSTAGVRKGGNRAEATWSVAAGATGVHVPRGELADLNRADPISCGMVERPMNERWLASRPTASARFPAVLDSSSLYACSLACFAGCSSRPSPQHTQPAVSRQCAILCGFACPAAHGRVGRLFQASDRADLRRCWPICRATPTASPAGGTPGHGPLTDRRSLTSSVRSHILRLRRLDLNQCLRRRTRTVFIVGEHGTVAAPQADSHGSSASPEAFRWFRTVSPMRSSQSRD